MPHSFEVLQCYLILFHVYHRQYCGFLPSSCLGQVTYLTLFFLPLLLVLCCCLLTNISVMLALSCGNWKALTLISILTCLANMIYSEVVNHGIILNAFLLTLATIWVLSV